MLMLVGICLFSTRTAHADVQYLGKVCLNLVSATAASETLQLESLSYGTDTFPVYGKILAPISGGFVPIPMHGGAVVNANTINISLNASRTSMGPGPLILSATYSLELNLQTLSGSFVVYKYVPSTFAPSPNPFEIVGNSGTVTSQVCP